MKKIKYTSLVLLGLILAAAICSIELHLTYSRVMATENPAPDIQNVLDLPECRQSDTITLSVYLQDINIQDVSALQGTLEYDNRLFTIEESDFLPTENTSVQACSFDADSGMFEIKYNSSIDIQDGSLLLQIRLHVAQDAPAGKTTVCVTHFGWLNAGNTKMTEIDHRIPARLFILEPASKTGDVNSDGSINLTDAKIIMQYYNGIQDLDTLQLQCADVNADSVVNLIDAKLIMKYYNGEIQKF